MRKGWMLALALCACLGLAACVTETPEKDPPPAMAQSLCAGWYVYNSAPDQEVPAALTFTENGMVTVDGTEMTWDWQNSGEDYLDGVIQDKGENRFYFFCRQPKDTETHSLYLATCAVDGNTIGNGTFLGEYSVHPAFSALNGSRWYRLDGEKGTPADFGIALDRAELNLDGESRTFHWKFVSEDDGEHAVLSLTDRGDASLSFTLTLGKRDGYPVIALKHEKTGALALYYTGGANYDPAWPEAVYPQALSWLKSYLDGNAFSVGDVQYRDHAAGAYLHDLFAGLESYRDSAAIAARFVALPSMYTGIVQKTTDELGNVRENYICRNIYDVSGRLIATNGSDAMELFGVYTEPYDIQHFTYAPDGKLEAVTVGTGSNITQNAAPTYDDQGRLVSLSVQHGAETYTSTFTYDKNGRVTKLSVRDGKIVFSYTYNKEGKLTQKVKRLKEGYSTTTRYTYKDGILTEINETYNAWNKAPVKTRYVYTCDDQGRPLSAEVTSEKGNFAAQELVYEYTDLWVFNTDGFTMFDEE